MSDAPEVSGTKVRKEGRSMITPITHSREMAFDQTTDDTRPKPLNQNHPINDKFGISKVNVGTEQTKEVPQDRVGKYDNLTALYWG